MLTLTSLRQTLLLKLLTLTVPSKAALFFGPYRNLVLATNAVVLNILLRIIIVLYINQNIIPSGRSITAVSNRLNIENHVDLMPLRPDLTLVLILIANKLSITSKRLC